MGHVIKITEDGGASRNLRSIQCRTASAGTSNHCSTGGNVHTLDDEGGMREEAKKCRTVGSRGQLVSDVLEVSEERTHVLRKRHHTH